MSRCWDDHGATCQGRGARGRRAQLLIGTGVRRRVVLVEHEDADLIGGDAVRARSIAHGPSEDVDHRPVGRLPRCSGRSDRRSFRSLAQLGPGSRSAGNVTALPAQVGIDVRRRTVPVITGVRTGLHVVEHEDAHLTRLSSGSRKGRWRRSTRTRSLRWIARLRRNWENLDR